MSVTYEDLPIIWKETYDKLKDNKTLSQTILNMYEAGLLDNLKPDIFLNGEIEKEFINSCGMTSEQINRVERGEKGNIVDLINKAYKELDLSDDKYTYNLYRTDETHVELELCEVDNKKSILYEFSHDDCLFVNDIFIKKNNLFHGKEYKILFDIFISEPLIDFGL
jgi:hypothetical protein